MACADDAPAPGVIDWLLEEDNPSVRYLTLTRLLGRPPSDPEAALAKRRIIETGWAARALDGLADGEGRNPARFYLDKYAGAVWQLIILAEHAADGSDGRIRAACEDLLARSQDPESGGFSVNQRAGGKGGRHGEVIPCLTGNMAWSLLQLGYGDDGRVRGALEWIVAYQRFDDGADEAPSGWPYHRFEVCWGRHSCHMGAVKALKALSAVPEERRTPGMKARIDEGVAYLLAHSVYRKSHDPGKTAKPGWLKFQFPLMYQTDVLEIVGILADLSVRDSRMDDALGVIRSKRTEAGTWNLEATFNGKFGEAIERKGRPSKWITYRALRVLDFYGGPAPAGTE